MKLTIKTLKQTTFTVDAEPTDTIRVVKEKIEASKGEEYYADGLKLIYSGKILVDAQTVAEYGIKETDFLVSMPGKPRAAAPAPAPAPVVAAPAPVTPAVAPAPVVAPPAPVAPAQPSFPEAVISNLTDMGFPRDQVIAALRAASGNPDAAVDFLMGGGAPLGGDFEDDGEDAEGGDIPDDGDAPGELAADSPLAFLLNNPQFTQLRGLIQQQPELLPAILQQLGQANPELIQLINDNREDFQALLNAPVQAGGVPQGAPRGGQQIQVTPEERQAIERLTSMGFDRNLVIQAYFACDKNEELAANYLLEHGFDE